MRTADECLKCQGEREGEDMKHSVKKQTHSRTMGPRCWFWVTQGSIKGGEITKGRVTRNRAKKLSTDVRYDSLMEATKHFSSFRTYEKREKTYDSA